MLVDCMLLVSEGHICILLEAMNDINWWVLISSKKGLFQLQHFLWCVVVFYALRFIHLTFYLNWYLQGYKTFPYEKQLGLVIAHDEYL